MQRDDTTFENVDLAQKLEQAIHAKRINVGIVGMGYVGLPLARAFANRDIRVIGFDIDPSKVDQLNAGNSYIRHISSDTIAGLVTRGMLTATTDFSRISECDAILVCVPTPLTKQREPDMTYVVSTSEAVAKHLRTGQLVILESTTYPGTTADLMRPILEAAKGLKCGQDFFLAFSPEREDPGNQDFGTTTIPKVVGADGPAARKAAVALYDQIVPKTVAVSSSAAAEAVKLTENIFRAVNIALVNELKLVYDEMGIDIWEVIDAAKSKPFGFMPFYPGPGLGGHCIPIDPFYLTWKAREYEISTRFIELAGEVNRAMPAHVVNRLALALDQRFHRSLAGAKILVVGLAYKKNIDDDRESPSLKIIDILERRGAAIDYHDPYVPVVRPTREYPHLAGKRSVPLTREQLGQFDAVMIVTDHDSVDYQHLVDHATLVVDTRNATRGVKNGRDKIVKA